MWRVIVAGAEEMSIARFWSAITEIGPKSVPELSGKALAAGFCGAPAASALPLSQSRSVKVGQAVPDASGLTTNEREYSWQRIRCAISVH